MNKPFNWKIFWILTAAAAFGLAAIVPYSLALQAKALETAKLPMPLWLLVPLQLLPQLIMFGLAVAIGLFCANRIGLGLPILESRLRGEPVSDKLRSILPISIVLGVLAGFLIIGLDAFVFQPALKAELADRASSVIGLAVHPAAWKGFLASFYGGINEEILLRLFVMSLLAWLGHFISKTSDGKPTTAVLWAANVLAAVLFGLGHLPTTALLVPLTPLVILRAIVLNGLGGIAFGYLYFTRGLESAMLSHFSADLVLHVLFAL
ncbi:MAG TPA: CPBP family intramembrane glutamic endopeptidase [Anaerolineales bacterium]